jgi:uncharacterized protein (DUF433 family)
MNIWRNHIESNPEIMFGKPVIKGTRVPVDLLLDKLSLGESFQDLLAAYPRIKMQDILAALAYASDAVKNDLYYPVAS